MINAVANAIGIDMNELPATADRVMEALVERRRQKRLGDARRGAA
jgi:4-hydroxybenzoyl-CoA reductase subunit alpha